MLRTAYSAQGLTLDGGVLVDLRRGGGLEDADWWLAIYVMLTRARKLKNLILLGFTEQVEELLRRGPPTYLRELTDKLETKAASTLERLQSWPVYDALQAIPDTVLCQWDLIGFDWRGPGRHRPDTLLYLWDLIGFDWRGLVEE